MPSQPRESSLAKKNLRGQVQTQIYILEIHHSTTVSILILALTRIYRRLWAGTRRYNTSAVMSIPGETKASSSMSSPETAQDDGTITPPAKKLHGRAFYESIGSPKFILAPMVDQSEFVIYSSSTFQDSTNIHPGMASFDAVFHVSLHFERSPRVHSYVTC